MCTMYTRQTATTTTMKKKTQRFFFQHVDVLFIFDGISIASFMQANIFWQQVCCDTSAKKYDIVLKQKQRKKGKIPKNLFF